MEKLLIVEDNNNLRPALKSGLEGTRKVDVVFDCHSGEDALEYCIKNQVDVILMDVQLSGEINGIEAAKNIRREFPRLPVVFYSIQDEDSYYRDFRNSGILSHYAYVRKSNFLLPEMIVPLLFDAISGRSFIDPDIETRVQEVRNKDEQSPMELLEPNEKKVALMLAQGMTNQQIAKQLGFKDKRTISRTNGQIYSAWGLNQSTTDEKIARTRAAIIARTGKIMKWDDLGQGYFMNEDGDWITLGEES